MLKAADAQMIVNLPTAARYVVQDGIYVNTAALDVYNNNGSAAHVNTIWGVTANDGASIGSTYPKTLVNSEVEGIQKSLGISKDYV